MDIEMRQLVFKRCQGYCEKCGGLLPIGDWAWHHRKLRSQGGTDTPENGMCVHHQCHNAHRDSIHLNPAQSQTLGYIVLQTENPLLKPVLLYGERGWWVTFNADGTYTKGIACLECGSLWDHPVQAQGCATRDKVAADEVCLDCDYAIELEEETS